MSGFLLLVLCTNTTTTLDDLLDCTLYQRVFLMIRLPPRSTPFPYAFFFLNDTAPPKIYPLPLPDALPISAKTRGADRLLRNGFLPTPGPAWLFRRDRPPAMRQLRQLPHAGAELGWDGRRAESALGDLSQIGRAHV